MFWGTSICIFFQNCAPYALLHGWVMHSSLKTPRMVKYEVWWPMGSVSTGRASMQPTKLSFEHLNYRPFISQSIHIITIYRSWRIHFSVIVALIGWPQQCLMDGWLSVKVPRLACVPDQFKSSSTHGINLPVIMLPKIVLQVIGTMWCTLTKMLKWCGLFICTDILAFSLYTLLQKKHNISGPIFPGDPGWLTQTPGHVHFVKWFWE